jgi:putative hydrolase of the HAD superfamily
MMTIGLLPPRGRVLVLDLDDTLYLERDYVCSGLRAVDLAVQRLYSVEGFFECAMAEFNTGRRAFLFDTVLSRLGLAATPDVITGLVSVYREHEPAIQLQPDAVDFLAQARPDYELAILTDGYFVSQRNKIRALGLDRIGIFPIVCTDSWGRRYWKPHVRGFRHIQSHHRVAAEACVYIADNPAKDFIAPRRLGWRTVQIKRPERIHMAASERAGLVADCEVESLAGLSPARLDQLMSGRGERAA